MTSNNRQESRIIRHINKLSDVFERFLGIASATTLVALCGVVLLQIFARLFIETPPVWTEELSRYLFIFLVSVSIGIAYKKGELVAVEIFYNWLPTKIEPIYRLLLSLSVFSFCIKLIPYAMEFAQIGEYQLSPTMYFPMSYVFFCTVLIFINIAIFTLFSSIIAGLEVLTKRYK